MKFPIDLQLPSPVSHQEVLLLMTAQVLNGIFNLHLGAPRADSMACIAFAREACVQVSMDSYHFLKSTLLRYDFHTMKHTHFKSMVQ